MRSLLSRSGRSHPIWMKVTSFSLLHVLLVAVTLYGCLQIGSVVSTFPQADKAVVALIAAALVGSRWGPFGYLCLLVMAASFQLPSFNFDRIPVIGLMFTGVSFQERIVLIGGIAYLGAMLFKSVEERGRWRLMPFVPLGIMIAYGALVARYFAWFAGAKEEIDWYRSTVLYGAVVFLLVFSFATTPRRVQTLITCLVLAGVLFSAAISVAPATSQTVDLVSTERLGGSGGTTWTFPLGIQAHGNSVYLGSWLALCNVLAFGEFLRSRANRSRWFWLGAIGLMTWVQLQTVSRTGLYGELPAIAILVIFYLFGNRTKTPEGVGASSGTDFGASSGVKRIVVLVLVTIAMALFVLVFIRFSQTFRDPTELERLTQPFIGLDRNTEERVSLFLLSLGNSIASPLGPGTLALGSVAGLNDHSLYTLLLAGLGWVGFAAFVVLAVWCIRQVSRGINPSDSVQSGLPVTLLCGLGSVFIMGLGHSFVAPLWGVTAFWTTLGLAAASVRWNGPAQNAKS